jgi:hypothetical protein
MTDKRDWTGADLVHLTDEDQVQLLDNKTGSYDVVIAMSVPEGGQEYIQHVQAEVRKLISD